MSPPATCHRMATRHATTRLAPWERSACVARRLPVNAGVGWRACQRRWPELPPPRTRRRSTLQPSPDGRAGNFCSKDTSISNIPDLMLHLHLLLRCVAYWTRCGTRLSPGNLYDQYARSIGLLTAAGRAVEGTVGHGNPRLYSRTPFPPFWSLRTDTRASSPHLQVWRTQASSNRRG